MNPRTLMIGGVLGCALGLASLAPSISCADQRRAESSPSRGAMHREPDAALNRVRTPNEALLPRVAPGLWRNPGSAATSEPIDPSRRSATPGDVETADNRDAATPAAQQTLIQRIRQRRLQQLEKQLERMRERAQHDAPPRSADADPNGPQNPDLQIDLGELDDLSGETEAVAPLIGPSHSPTEVYVDRNAGELGESVRPSLPDLNPPVALPASPPFDWPDSATQAQSGDAPPADPSAQPSHQPSAQPYDLPIEIQIDIPGDGMPPPPRASLRERVRGR